jgi:hypothetical protein
VRLRETVEAGTLPEFAREFLARQANIAASVQ